MLNKRSSVFCGFIFKLITNFSFFKHTALILVRVNVNDFVIIDEVNNTLKCILAADRKLDWKCVTFETVVNHIKNAIKIRTHNIHFINKYHTRYIIFISLTPYGFRLRLNTAFCTKNGNRAVKYTQRTLYLNCEVNVARCINDIDSMAFPEASCSSRSDCNTSLLLLIHPVHCCGTVVCFTDFVVNAGIVKNTLGSSSLTRINVSHNTNVSCLFKSYFSWHNILLGLVNGLISEMSKCLVCFCHLVCILTLLNCSAC